MDGTQANSVAAQPLWAPSPEQSAATNMVRFIATLGFTDYEELYEYSIINPAQFWSKLWDFSQVIGTKGEILAVNLDSMEEAQFFPEATLNFAENLLRRRDHTVAIQFFAEDQIHQTLTWAELYQQVAQLAHQFIAWGIQPGDRIAGYLPNLPETVIAMLAATTIGAVWSSCSPDFGSQGVIDRFAQISPKILIVADGYFYNGKRHDCLDKIPDILAKMPTVTHTLVIKFTSSGASHPYLDWHRCLQENSEVTDIPFARLPFNHPLCILFSSGTTGIPKCIVHRAGGVLLQHLKEHQLHSDLQANDVLFYFTTCGWMMWNWLVTGLASKATIVLYDGSPAHPDYRHLFDIAENIGITHFGTSAKFIDALAKQEIDLIKTHRLEKLRLILSTGSPLSPESFDYVYAHLKKDVCLASIAGGTDIVSCFALGNPMAPVWRGELQTRGLAMKVEVFNDAGRPLYGEKGELVCTAPFPSQPLGFWQDRDGQKYHNTYYARFANTWHHGDYVEITPHGGLIFHGRSDAVLNPGGVRIGTAEIYRQVEQINEVLECIAVGQNWQGDVRVILFVKLRPGIDLDEVLTQKISQHIRTNTTPRHVPAIIVAIRDIPRTKSGKIAEIAVRNIINGEAVNNREALANPEALELYANLAELRF